jgi:hypothetical protein
MSFSTDSPYVQENFIYTSIDELHNGVSNNSSSDSTPIEQSSHDVGNALNQQTNSNSYNNNNIRNRKFKSTKIGILKRILPFIYSSATASSDSESQLIRPATSSLSSMMIPSTASQYDFNSNSVQVKLQINGNKTVFLPGQKIEGNVH